MKLEGGGGGLGWDVWLQGYSVHTLSIIVHTLSIIVSPHNSTGIGLLLFGTKSIVFNNSDLNFQIRV